MMRFEADLQVVRASPADGEIGLSASRWALAEAAIVADISAAVEEELLRKEWCKWYSLSDARYEKREAENARVPALDRQVFHQSSITNTNSSTGL